MDELIRQLITYLRGIWLRRWTGLAVAWLIAIAGGAVLLKMPDRYEAQARVFVDTQSILKPLMSGLTVQPDVDQQVAMLSRTLISRPNIEKLIRMTDLDLNVKSPQEHEQLVDRLTRTVQVRSNPGRENQIYTIAYTDTNRGEAQRVVQALLSIFVESSLGDKRRGADTARRFIEEQIKAYEQKLEEAENRLKDFKLKNMGVMGPAGQDYFGKVGVLNHELTQARMQLHEAEQSRDALKRELAGEVPVYLPETDTARPVDTQIPEIDARIDALKKSMDDLLRRYTEEHPDVIGTRRVIEQLEEQKRHELKARKKPDAPKPTISANSNPVFQQIKVSLAEAEANVAALRARVSDLDARYRELQGSARLLPQVEAQLAQLNRDYEVQKRNYEALVARRESAAITTDMDSTAGIAEFRIIDPPSVPSQPVAPKRALLMLLVLAAAFGAGVFASFVASQVFPTFHDGRLLREVAKRPMLGTVSLLATPQVVRKRRRGALLFAGCAVALVCVAGGAMLLVSIKTPLI